MSSYLNGSSPSTWQQHKCQQLNMQHCHPCMPSLKDCRIILRRNYAISHPLHQLIYAMLWLNPTGSSVTISSKLTSCHIQFGQAKSHFDCGIFIKLMTVLLPTVLDPGISYLYLIHTYHSQRELLAEFKAHKLELELHYKQHYAPRLVLTLQLP